MPSYYAWSGVGAIEDFDGENILEAKNRLDALSLFVLLVTNRTDDLTLWERDGNNAVLLAAKHGGHVATICHHDGCCVTFLKDMQ